MLRATMRVFCLVRLGIAPAHVLGRLSIATWSSPLPRWSPSSEDFSCRGRGGSEEGAIRDLECHAIGMPVNMFTLLPSIIRCRRAVDFEVEGTRVRHWLPVTSPKSVWQTGQSRGRRRWHLR